MSNSAQQVPGRAWVVTFAGMAVNLCLGILYAWSVWKKALLETKENVAGTAMTGLNEGWHHLTNSDATWAYCACGFTFALFMIPGGIVQDRLGPKVGATAGGLLLAAGCILAGYMQSFIGLLLGFGLLGGIGMGLGYAAATPAAVKWFGPQRRGLIVGIVVGGYGAAAIYISPLASWIIANYGLSTSFIGLGILFAAVVVVAGQLLSRPPKGYVPLGAPNPTLLSTPTTQSQLTGRDWTAGKMLKTWQYYALVAMFIGSAQSGLLVIANATPILNDTAKAVALFAANTWILSSLGGFVNASGRIGTGLYSDRVGRRNAYQINGLLAVVCLFALPSIMEAKNVWLFIVAVNVVYWQYGGGLSLMPAFTADFFGAKNLGFNYGLVFLGWGIAFFVPQLAGYIKDQTGGLNGAFYLSGCLLAAAIALSYFVQRPLAEGEKAP